MEAKVPVEIHGHQAALIVVDLENNRASDINYWETNPDTITYF